MLRPDPIKSARDYAIYTKGRIAVQEYARFSEMNMLARMAEAKEYEDQHFNTQRAAEFAEDICRKIPRSDHPH